MNDLKPLESGSSNAQTDQPAQEKTGEYIPRPQLPNVARRVTAEAAGLVQGSPGGLSQDAQRLLIARTYEQDSHISDQRRDAKEAAERERELRDALQKANVDLAGARQALISERGTKKPRAVFSTVGGLLMAVGGEQYASGHVTLGVTLFLCGLALVVGSALFSTKDQT